MSDDNNNSNNNEAASSHASVWPLYLFSFFHVMGIAVLFGDLCNYMTSTPCNDAENVASKSFGITVAYTGVLYFVLIYLAKSQPAKLQRLATFATHSMALIMAGVVFTAGKEPQSNHIGDMVGGMLVFLLLLLYHPVQDGTTPPIGPTSPCTGLGLNPKTLVLIIAILLLVKIFVLVDFWDPSYILIHPELATEFASFLWHWVAIYMLEIFLATIYVLLYGDARDQEAYLITTIVLSILTAPAMIPITHQIKTSILRQSIITGTIFLLVCIAAIFWGRRTNQRHYNGGYESVASNNNNSH